MEEKKMILSRLIEKIPLDMYYHTNLHFYILFDPLKESLEHLKKTRYNVIIENG